MLKPSTLILILSLVISGCVAEIPDFSESSSEDTGSDAVRDDDPHLPGGCTNWTCEQTNPDPNGQGGGSSPAPTQYCTGCVCTATPTTCDSCVRRCLHRREICLYNGGGSNCGTGGDCNTECNADNLVCVCPTQH